MREASGSTGKPRPPLLAEAWPLASWHEALVLFGLPLLLYGGSLRFGLLHYDDTTYYLANPALHGGGAQGLRDLWRGPFFSEYFPLTQLTYWVDLALFGSAMWTGARLHGLLWFALGAWMVRALVLRLTGRRGLSFSVALLYVVHPVCVPSAVWLAERKNLVCFAFSFWCVERYVAARRGEASAQWRRGWPALVLATLALLAKAHAVAVPVMLAVYESTLGEGSWPRRAARVAPFALVAGTFAVLSLTLWRQDLSEASLGGSRLAAWVSDGPILLRYAGHTLAPVGLSFLYSAEGLPPASLWGWGAWASLGLCGFGLVRASRQGRLVACAWLLGLAALLPALNLVPQVLPMADYYHQWALPGWLLGLALCGEELLARLGRGWERRGRVAACAACVVVLGALTLLRIPLFESRMTLFQDACERQPASAAACAQYAFSLLASARSAEAGRSALQALDGLDAARLPPEERGRLIRMTVRHLRREGKEGEARRRLEVECETFQESWAPLAELVRAQAAVDSDRPGEALALLAPYFKPAQQEAARSLRAHCRSGEPLPDAFAPILVLPFREGDAAKEQTGRAFLLERQRVLAEAYLRAGEPENAFDVAAVLMNMAPDFAAGRETLGQVYQALDLPAAAEALLSRSVLKSER